MLKYREILELHFEETSQRTIAPVVGPSRTTISEVIKGAKKKEIGELGVLSTRLVVCAPRITKKKITLMLPNLEYSETAREANKVPYSYRIFAEKYRKIAKKTKATLPIRRKSGDIIEKDWAICKIGLNVKLLTTFTNI